MWPDAEDIDHATGMRRSVMLSFTVSNPRTCLQPDDIEALNLLYPVCTGRAMVRNTAEAWSCNKSDAKIGYVRVLARTRASDAALCTAPRLGCFATSDGSTGVRPRFYALQRRS